MTSLSDLTPGTRPSDGSWGTPDWPAWVTAFRPHQLTAVDQILDGYARGKKVMVLDAPVGAGKTLIAEMVRRRLAVDMLYVAHSRGLQDQMLRDFPYSRVLKGRANYPTEHGPGWVTAADCTAKGGAGAGGCAWCDKACPYGIAKQEARAARVAVVNTAYMLAEAGGRGALCSGRQFVCVDECDTLEGIVAGNVEFGIKDRDLAEGLVVPKKGVHGKTVAAWLRDEWMVVEMERYKQLRARARGAGDADKVKLERKLKQSADRMARATLAAEGISGEAGEDAQWVRDYGWGYALQLKPVMIDWCANTRVWRHGEKWLLMSGTVVDADVMCGGLGLERDEWELVTVPMTFAAENRAVKVVPVADMGKKNMDANREQVVQAIESALWVVLDRHKGENTLVHTVSYALTEVVEDIVREWAGAQEDMGGDRIIVHSYRKASERDETLERFKAEGGIIVGPSLDRGVDLPGDLCRVQVIVKVPFPNLGDKVVSTRMRGGNGGGRWYATETARTIVQMTGRGVRGADDWCVSYILDRGFLKWLNADGKALLPRWWQDAMKVELVKEYQ